MTNQPTTNNVIDKIKAGLIITAFIILLIVIFAFLWACWRALSDQTRPFVQTWAFVTTILLPIASLSFAGLGFWLGVKQADFILTGANVAIGRIFNVANKVADVKVNTYSRYKQLSITQPVNDTSNLFGPLDRSQLPSVNTPSTNSRSLLEE